MTRAPAAVALALGTALAGCQTESRNDLRGFSAPSFFSRPAPVASSPLDGQWASTDGIFVASFALGPFRLPFHQDRRDPGGRRLHARRQRRAHELVQRPGAAAALRRLSDRRAEHRQLHPDRRRLLHAGAEPETYRSGTKSNGRRNRGPRKRLKGPCWYDGHLRPRHMARTNGKHPQAGRFVHCSFTSCAGR